MTRRFSTLAATALLAAGLAGCTGLGEPPPDMALFDLGSSAPLALDNAHRPASVDVRAPSWLTTSAMQYRLAYADPQRRLAYGESRWAATPAEMLMVALDRALRVPGAGDSGCRLRVELDEFAQVFSAADASELRIAVRATLLPSRGETPVAGRDLAVGVATRSADAHGGVAAAQGAVRELAAELGNWLAALDPSAAQGLNGGAGCRASK
ncbi:ABC-type transport auxiliary lipoprotein family protein [Pseudothauera rhizosphaerae]|nr:ABC-type transport auxiliary lipoprotein family protein [Pseudothauera rhizosphaerae]